MQAALCELRAVVTNGEARHAHAQVLGGALGCTGG